MNSRLPKDWKWNDLGDIGISSNQSIVPSKYPGEMFELWSVPNFDFNKPEYLQGNEIGSNKCLVRENDVLLCKINPRINRVWKVKRFNRFKQIASTEWIVIRNEQLNPDFLVYQLRSSRVRNEMLKDVSGVGGSLMRARPNAVKKLKIAVPPRKVQDFIVSKIEELFSELDKGIENLRLAQQQLKTYSQSVLKWVFEEIENKKLQTVEDCCTHIVDCLHSTAKFSPSGYYCVDTTCIQNGRIIFDKVRYVDEKIYNERISRLKPQEGDILFAREGTVGTTLIVPHNIELCLGQRMMMFRLKNKILPKYFMYYFQSLLFKSQYQPLITGTTAPHLNIRDIRKFYVVICSTNEQQKIVQEIESRLSVADKMEESINQSLQQAEALRQSILKKAFEGKLIN